VLCGTIARSSAPPKKQVFERKAVRSGTGLSY
jgi:hypothetical protein